MNKKLIILIILITLLTLLALTLLSCGINPDRAETRLEKLATESDGKYNFVKADTTAIENTKKELQNRIGKDFDGKVTHCLTLVDKETEDYCALFAFEKESDAKLLEENCNAAFLGAHVLRKGNVLLVGDEKIVDLILKKI